MNNISIESPETVLERQRQGTIFRNILNELKRDVPSAAKDLGTQVEVLEGIIDGSIELPFDLVKRATAIWPVNERDFFILKDDTRKGIKICRAGDSLSSRRVLKRGAVDYYEYRDTAMSKLAMFRPEWIEMLVEVDDQNPGNSRIKWNKGHFLYQFTFFVGDINYYYEWKGVKKCASMETGDSVFGLPYSPHTFAKRGSKEAYILALTFGSRLLGDCQQELLTLGEDKAVRFAGESMFIKHLRDSGLTLQALARKADVSEEVLNEMIDGTRQPNLDVLSKIAQGLQITLRDLLDDTAEKFVDGVKFVKAVEAFEWEVPQLDPIYKMRALAGCRSLFGARALQITCLQCEIAGGLGYLETSQHQYCYNIGTTTIRIEWFYNDQLQQELLGPGDSMYIVPFVKHRFIRNQMNDNSGVLDNSLLVLRVPGKIGNDEVIEASFVGAEAIGRFVKDNQQWYQS